MKRTFRQIGLAGVAAASLMLALGGTAEAVKIDGNNITLRMGSGHPDFLTYTKFMKVYFAETVAKRVAAETKYKIKFQQHYFGKIVKVHDTLEGVQDGRLDIGGWCVCFDDDKAMAMNLGYYVPFGEPSAVKALKSFRRVVDEFPEIHQDYEKRYKQKLLALSGFNNYGLLTKFDWTKFEELKGKKILAAGPNLPWVKGAIPVRTSIPVIAQQLQTGVGAGVVLFPDTDFKLKLHEATKGGTYTITDFGAVTQISLTMGLKARKKLPKEVVKIIDEVAREYEIKSLIAAQNDHDSGIYKLKGVGIKIRTITPEAKIAWANRLKDWPGERAAAVSKRKNINMGKIMKAYIKYQKEEGHKFPIDFPIK
jgi:TRAP-type C4-dicarboxylate transport system substrate-binding protein